MPTAEDAQKVPVPQNDIKSFWEYWQSNLPYHEACLDKTHNPIGLFGDDAKWSLAGAKIICVMMNLVLDRKTRTSS